MVKITRNPSLCTRNPSLCTRNPLPCTRNPLPTTPNPLPSTRTRQGPMSKDNELTPIAVSFRDRHVVKPGSRVDLSRIDAADAAGLVKGEQVEHELQRLRAELDDLQERFYAWDKRSLLLVLQAMDTGGKDGAIEQVMQWVNPQGVAVTSFKAPTPEELSHDFLWRIHKAVPARRMIGVFNRSHYEDVLVVRVHNLVPEDVWRRRYDEINQFERLLADNGAVILKFYLHISKEEQAERLQERLDDPDKCWKFALGDLKEREQWDHYMEAYQDALAQCSTEYAPWYVIPANRNWYRNLAITSILVDALKELNPSYPKPDPALENIVVT